ncbi:MAG TPA: hypothetical protein VFE25_08230, partial [Opitutaceae bacterium]|nr:hypothetical protein [Opitutaceae bacterium]
MAPSPKLRRTSVLKSCMGAASRASWCFVGACYALSAATAFGGVNFFTSPQISDGQSVGAFAALQPNGKVLVSGGAIRLNADGSTDTSYSLALSGPTPQVAEAAKVAPDGDIVVVDNSQRLVDCSSTGAFKQEIYSGISPTAFLVQGDGKILIWTSNAITVQGVTRQGIARINVDGTLDTSFDPGFGPNAQIASVLLLSDGKIMVGGFFNTFDKVAVLGFVRLNSNGSVDQTFSVTIQSAPITEMAEMPNGQVAAWNAATRQLEL